MYIYYSICTVLFVFVLLLYYEGVGVVVDGGGGESCSIVDVGFCVLVGVVEIP